MDYEYKAFISYSHSDTAWAQWLLQALETYRLPAALRAPLGRAKGVGRIFRDRDEASAASDLKDEIQRALLASEHLIIIASPRSAKSAYVQAEIEAFAEANRTRAVPGHILTLIIDGEPNAGDSDRECFPPALRGNLLKADGSALEPLAADARPTGDGRTRALAKLAAALLNIRYDVLVRRDLQRQRRVRLLAAGASFAVLATAVIVGAVVITGNLEQERLLREREAAERDARTVLAINDALRAEQLFEDGKVRDAVDLARKSLPDDGSIPFIPQAYNVLYKSRIKSAAERTVPIGHSRTRGLLTERLADSSFITVTTDGTTVVWSSERGVISRRTDTARDTLLSVAPDGDAAFTPLSGAGVARYDTNGKAWQVFAFDSDVKFHGVNVRALVALDRDHVALCSVSSVLLIKLPTEPAQAATLVWESRFNGGHLCLGLFRSSNGSVLADTSDGVRELAAADGQPLRRYDSSSIVLPDFVYADDRHVILSSPASGARVFDRESTALKLSLEEIATPRMIGPNGRFVLEITANDELVIHDLSGELADRPVPCPTFDCEVAGFLDDTRFAIVTDGTQLQIYDALSSEKIRDGYRFAAEIEEVIYVAEEEVLLGWRPNDVVAFVQLDDRRYDPLFVADASGEAIGMDFDLVGPATVVAGLHSVGDDDRYAARLLRRGDPGSEASQVGEPIMFDESPHAHRIDDGTFAIAHFGGHTRLFDATSGAQLLSAEAESIPQTLDGRRYVAIDTYEAAQLYDRASGKIVPLFADEARTQGVALWVLSDNLVLVAGENESRVFRITGGAISEVNALRMSRGVLDACMTSDGTHLYTVSAGLQLTVRNLDGEKILSELVAPDNDDARGVFDFAGLRRAESRCTPRGIVVNGDSATGPRAVIWDVAAGTVTVGAGFDEGWWEPTNPETGIDVVSSATSIDVVDLIDRSTTATLFAGNSLVQTALLIPARNMLAAGLQDGTLLVWDLSSSEAPIIDVPAAAKTIDYLDADPSGSVILTADDDDAVSLWPIPTVAELLSQTTP